MATSKAAMTVLRLVALLGIVLIFTLGVWSLTIVEAMSSRGLSVLSTSESGLGADAASWSQYINAAAKGSVRAWIITIISSMTALLVLLVITSNRYYWLRISTVVVLLIEVTSASSATVTFGCALSLAIDLNAFRSRPLPIINSADLWFFDLLNPLTRGLAITTALTTALIIATTIASFLDLRVRHVQARDIRAFEPTVSALGMSHGFHALHPQPQMTGERIPTMYDPYRAYKKGPGTLRITKQVSFADEATWMSRKSATSRWSASTSSPRGMEGDIMRLLDVKKARRAVPVRPARPSSGVRNVI